MVLVHLDTQQTFHRSHIDGYSVDEMQFFLRLSADKCVYSEVFNRIKQKCELASSTELVFTPPASLVLSHCPCSERTSALNALGQLDSWI
jgi:hypothetical protein